MNSKGDIFSIISKPELVVAVLLLGAVVLFLIFSNSNQSEFQQNQTKIVEELKGNVQTLTSSLDSIKTSVLLLNQNIDTINKTKANEDTVKQLSSDIQKLNSNIEKTNATIVNLTERVTAVEENVKIIEPTSTQNIQLQDLRTYVNITNFRLIINFFIAIAISLFSIELIKLFGDFLSFGYLTKNYDITTYLNYRKTKRQSEILVLQQNYVQKKDEINSSSANVSK